MKPKITQIETERLILREATLEDAEAYAKLGLATYSSGRINNPKVARKYLQDSFSNDDSIEVAVILKAENALIGHIELCHMKRFEQGIEICYHLRRKYWGKGYATESSRAIIHYCFTKLGYRKIYADTEPTNLASQRVLEKLGFKLEGRIRQRRKIKGVWTDELDYGLLRGELK